MVYYQPSTEATLVLPTVTEVEMNPVSPVINYQPGQAATKLMKMEHDEAKGIHCGRCVSSSVIASHLFLIDAESVLVQPRRLCNRRGMLVLGVTARL